MIWNDEEWRDVVGLPRYSVSDFGRVYDHKREQFFKLTPDRTGYIRVKLWVNDVRMSVSVSRLVAFAFLDYSDENPEVNHIDGDKTYNYIANLEWTNRSKNMKHAYENHLSDVPKRTPVICVETNKEYYSTNEAARDLGISCGKSIARILDNPNKTSNGYHFIRAR